MQMENSKQIQTLNHLAALQRNASSAGATRPPVTDAAFAEGNGLIPGAIAATVFISFLLSLYAVLWKCMVSPPQRKKRKSRIREHPRTAV